jgi:hypothetical protein
MAVFNKMGNLVPIREAVNGQILTLRLYVRGKWLPVFFTSGVSF